MPTGTCKGDSGVSYCCDEGVDTSSCHWNKGNAQCKGSTVCAAGESRITLDQHGGPDAKGDTYQCKVQGDAGPTGNTPWINIDISFCCNPSAMGTVRFPLDLED
jgi:chitinase